MTIRRKLLIVRASNPWAQGVVGSNPIAPTIIRFAVVPLHGLRLLRYPPILFGLWQSTRSIRHGLLDADYLTALRALAEEMTGAIHFVSWSKPTHFGQFWPPYAVSFPQAGQFDHQIP